MAFIPFLPANVYISIQIIMIIQNVHDLPSYKSWWPDVIAFYSEMKSCYMLLLKGTSLHLSLDIAHVMLYGLQVHYFNKHQFKKYLKHIDIGTEIWNNDHSNLHCSLDSVHMIVLKYE